MSVLRSISDGLHGAIRRLMATPAPGKSQRYKCLRCRDEGIVKILHPKYIQALVREEADAIEKHCFTMCDCESVNERQRLKSQRDEHGRRTVIQVVPNFGSEEWHIRADDPDARAKAANYRHKPEGYYEEFSEFDTRRDAG